MHEKFKAYAIVNNKKLFSVHPTKEQARLVKKQECYPSYFKIIKLEGLS